MTTLTKKQRAELRMKPDPVVFWFEQYQEEVVHKFK
jgi:hypothetical protein